MRIWGMCGDGLRADTPELPHQHEVIGKLSSYVMVLTTGKEISVPKSRYPEVKRQYTLFKGAE